VKLTIITVVKNDSKNILNTIESIKGQNFFDYEYLIVDGNSNDGTTEIIQNEIKDFKNFFHIIREDKNLYDALNHGIEISNGDYIALLHSGDTFLNNGILNLISKKIHGLDVLSGKVIYKNKSKVTRYWNYRLKKLSKFNAFKIAHTSLVLKKKIINEIGNYNTNYDISSDTDFILRLSLKNNLKYKFVDQVLISMKDSGLSSSRDNFIKKASEDFKIYKNFFGNKFIIFYISKIIYKLFKLIEWKVFSKNIYK
tara:strand:+ start:19 stop:780 length:762 start_codon:yes stop_codon:yes gene_type:complete